MTTPWMGWVDGKRFYIDPAAWAEIHAGADAQRAAEHLRDAGYLVPEGPDRLKRRVPSTIPGRPRAYCIKAEILRAETGGMPEGEWAEASGGSG